MSYSKILIHVVWATKNRRPVLTKSRRVRLYKYIMAILQNKGCHVYAINGIEDHIHIALSLRPAISLSSLMQDIKVASSKFLKQEKLFQEFNGWQIGYGAFTHSMSDKDYLVNYIERQEEHHAMVTFEDEFIQLLNEHHVDWKDEYLFEDE